MSAKQKGDRKLKGSLGDVTFKRGKNGNYIAHEKVESIAGKIATDARFEMTRQNNNEFGRAGAAGKLIRDAIRSKTKLIADNDATPRLLTLLLRIAKADPVSDRGQRKVSNGPVELLEGFEFNLASALNIILTVPFTSVIDRVAGTLKVDIAGFEPAAKMKVPAGATHFRIFTTALELDFETGEYTAGTNASAQIPCTYDPVADISLTATVTPGSTKPLIQLLSLQFSQLANGKYYPIIKADFNPLKIVKVNTA